MNEKFLLVHHSGHPHQLSPITRHLQIAHEDGGVDGPFAVATPDVLNRSLQLVPARSSLHVNEKRGLFRLALRREIDTTDRDRSDRCCPCIMLTEQLPPCLGDLHWTSCRKLKLALVLPEAQLRIADGDLNAVCHELMDAEPMPQVLGKLQNDLLHLLLGFEVGTAGDAMPHRFDGRDKILVHDP